MAKKNMGLSFDDFLKEEAMLEDVTAVAMKRVISWQIAQEMKAQQLTKTALAKRMHSSRASLNRLLDENDASLTLTTLASAAAALADWFSPAAGSPYSHSASAALCGAEALVLMHLGKVLPPPLEAPEGLRVLVRALLRAADSSPVVGAGAALARCAAQVLCSTGSAEDLVDALSVEVPPFAAVHGIITDALVARE
jgi:hypothetical protein